MFVHDRSFRYMHVPGQLIFKHKHCQELTINFRSRLVKAFTLFQRKSGRNLKLNHGIAVKYIECDVNFTPNWQLAVPQRMTALYIPEDIYHCIFAYIINGNVDRSLISALGKLRFT
jgi:hypothetical protein